MRRVFIALSLLSGLLLAGCATPYQASGLTGGYSEKEIEPSIWRVAFSGNGHANYETVQTYWLYRAAEVAMEKGYDGFEILSQIRLVSTPIKDVQVAAGAPIYIPMYMPSAPMPFLEADIKLLKAPITPQAGRVYDASALKAVLEDFVKGKRCDMGNVCPHVHRYIYEAVEAD